MFGSKLSQDQRPTPPPTNPILLYAEQKQNQKDPTLSLPRAWLQSLVGELRSRKPQGMAKQTNKQNESLNKLFLGCLLFQASCWLLRKKLANKTDALIVFMEFTSRRGES